MYNNIKHQVEKVKPKVSIWEWVKFILVMKVIVMVLWNGIEINIGDVFRIYVEPFSRFF